MLLEMKVINRIEVKQDGVGDGGHAQSVADQIKEQRLTVTGSAL